MIQVTIFGGHDGQLRYDKYVYITLFGGCEMVRPTIARQLVMARQPGGPDQPKRRKPFFLTIFGGSEIKSPTLAEEFIDLRELIATGMLQVGDWERALTDLARADTGVASFTLFGGFDERALPSEDEEVEGLALQRHLGNIPEPAGQILQFGIGQHGSERTATLRRALAAAG
jgi:hypothetical protein